MERRLYVETYQGNSKFEPPS